MSDPVLATADWYRALTLSERAELLRKAPGTGPGQGHPIPEDPERAKYRLDSWKNQSPFGKGDRFLRRLALDRLDEESFTHLLSVSAEGLRARLTAPPGWLVELQEAYSAPEDTGTEPPALPESVRADPMGGFLELLRPLLGRARERLRAGIARIARDGTGLPFDTVDIEGILFGSLPARLLWMLDRTLVLELNVARLRGQLRGATPEERFRDFVEGLRRRDAALAILQEYPVLARQVVERIETWLETSLEFLGRLGSDWPLLRSEFFAGADPGRVSEISGGAGDSHRGGRSVVITRFTSGAKIVYKPRSLSVDIRFQELLDWLNRRGDYPPFRTLKVLDRASHGWVEFVEASPCSSAEEVERYHRRLGGLLAILYAIGAVDFHFENLIASGDQPVPIDLESLLHPRIPRPEFERPDERLAVRALWESVLRVGLLPYRVGEDQEFAGSDLSGVASVAGKPSPDRVLQWEQVGSDQMKATRKRLTMAGGRNRPTFGGKEADVADHIDAVSGGFQEFHRLLVRHREALLSGEGPLARFSQNSVRAVLRSTRGYGFLLEDSFHPDFLRDALDRDRFFDRLWVGIEELPALERVIPREHRDLWAGDVPYFEARVDSTDLLDSRGEPIPGYLLEPSLAAVRRRITQMREEDLERQTWLTRISLGTLLLNRDKGDWPGFPLTDPGTPAGGEALSANLITAARNLGDWFDRMAVRDERDLTWVGVDLRNQVWSLFPISEDLYAGTPGIALFLGYLGAVTGDARYGDLARRGMNTLLRRLDHVAGDVRSIGLYQGWGGVIYTLAHLGALGQDAGLLERAERMADRIASLADADADLDVVAGAAGGTAGLLALGRASGSKRALEVARQCGERLLSTAKPTGPGVSWFIRIGGDEPQTGFSHGASGIALALADLAAATGDERFRRTALSAFDFEREYFWRDLYHWVEEGTTTGTTPQDRDRVVEKTLAMTWCYGAPGIGLARLGALRHLDDPVLREELDRAVSFTVERGFGKNHCLCHGDLGNLDLLLLAHAKFGDPGLAGTILRLTRGILRNIETSGWLCGTVGSIEAPGLMNGLAGIGYGLLRAASPDRVPSVLAMEPPIR